MYDNILYVLKPYVTYIQGEKNKQGEQRRSLGYLSRSSRKVSWLFLAPHLFSFLERGAKELTWALRKHILTSVKSGEKLDIKRYIKAPHLKGLNLWRLEKLPTPEALLPVGESNTTPLQTPENNRKGATLQCNNVVVWLEAGWPHF